MFAEHAPFPVHGDEGYADLGEVEQEFWIVDGRSCTELPAVARERLQGVEHLEITAAGNGEAFHRPVWSVEPPEVVTFCQNSRRFRLWNPLKKSIDFRILRDGQEQNAGELPPNGVVTIVAPRI